MRSEYPPQQTELESKPAGSQNLGTRTKTYPIGSGNVHHLFIYIFDFLEKVIQEYFQSFNLKNTQQDLDYDSFVYFSIIIG